MRMILCLILLLTGLAHAAEPAELPKDAPVDAILDALDARGDALKDFQAKLTFSEVDNDTASSTVRTGTVRFRRSADGQATMLVTFDAKSVNDRKPVNERSTFLLTPPWLIERDDRARKEIRRKVLNEGEKVNLLKLGEGPFPLPLGQDKKDVHAEFDVKPVAPAADDPANALHLQLVPKAGRQFARKYASIDVWVDARSHMPVRVAVTDRNNAKTRTTELAEVKVNVGLTDDAFALKPLPEGWTTVDERYQD